MKALRRGPGLRHLRRTAAAILMLTCWAGKPMAQTGPDREYRVKAVFLFNFAQFVGWPAMAFSGKDTPLVMGILGPDPFKVYLDEVVRGEKVDNRPIRVRRYGRMEEVEGCHLLFIGGSHPQASEQELAALQERGILTVGDAEGFSEHGGMVGFIMKKGKLRFQINLAAVHTAHLTVSSKLMRLADIVNPDEG